MSSITFLWIGGVLLIVGFLMYISFFVGRFALSLSLKRPKEDQWLPVRRVEFGHFREKDTWIEAFDFFLSQKIQAHKGPTHILTAIPKDTSSLPDLPKKTCLLLYFLNDNGVPSPFKPFSIHRKNVLAGRGAGFAIALDCALPFDAPRVMLGSEASASSLAVVSRASQSPSGTPPQ